MNAPPRITIEPVALDFRFIELHRKSAARTLTPAEADELDRLCAEKEAAWEASQ